MSTMGPDANAPWYMKYGARGVGTAGGIIAMGLGFFNCLTFSAWCLVAGIYQLFAGFIVVSAEAPCCCMFIDFVQRYSKFVEERPQWQKAALYIVLSLPGIIMCQSVSIFFGSGFIFLTGVLYGMMALGRKGSRNDMLAAAQASGPVGATGMKSSLVNMEAPPATS
ncbi:calcium channel flower-like isoform X2 [Hyalella azteca]|uniref:Calcium channel flower n=1 Tax=Hyalella azteca TaxID=294128 RepID=A0A8B7PKN6_HYAAZ|nr:calcium channel flower-like isoform X2 [Hyalella azteca]